MDILTTAIAFVAAHLILAPVLHMVFVRRGALTDHHSISI